MTQILVTGLTPEAFFANIRAIIREEVDQMPAAEATPAAESDQFLTIRKTAELLSISRATVYDLIQREVLTTYKLGGRTLLKKAEVLGALIPGIS